MAAELLEDLTNLDAELAGWLRAAGIETPAALRGTGAIGAYLACAESFEDTHDSSEWGDWRILYAFEGAIRGVEAEEIPEHDRDALRADAEQALRLAEL